MNAQRAGAVRWATGRGPRLTAKREVPKPPPVIERFIKSLVVTAKAVVLYPPASNIPLETALEAAMVLGEALVERPEVRLIVTKQGLYYNDVPIFSEQAAYENFALDLYNRHLADVRFHVGTTAKEIVSFLSVLKYTPEEIGTSGGFENRLWELGVSTITVTEAHVAIVDAAALSGAESNAATAPPLARNEIDELLAAAYGGRPRDQITVARFAGESAAVARYLTETFAGSGGLPDLMSAGERFAEIAEIAYESGGDDRHRLMASLGDALEQLDPALRRAMLIDEILPEARTNESLAAVVRQLDIDSVCRMLVAEMDADQVSRDGLARAIRNLALISIADRDEVVSAAGAAMRGAGIGESVIGEVLELASPSRLTVREMSTGGANQERPVDTIFKLMDLAPTPQREAPDEDDPGIAALKVEARRGLTDGDVIMALVSLVGMDARENQFASTMSMLEDSLDLLIDRGEIDIAADAADALKAASENPDLTPEQRSRVGKAVGRFTKPADIRAVAHALRLYPSGSSEHEAARRLLDALGPLALEPLLEQLADEPDMSVRKSLVDLLSQMAPGYIRELGAYVTDARWFVVRNVVGILGSTHSSAALPYLERTVRHQESRVRREAIRALSGINDRFAHEMLIATLNDEDPQNVQLAARYLGASGVLAAVPVLEQVARGEGRGSRDSGPRVEAIEALGRLGATQALATLESLAGKRAFLGAQKARELRAAAESAIARIKTHGGAR